jgi:hypothetical protein
MTDRVSWRQTPHDVCHLCFCLAQCLTKIWHSTVYWINSLEENLKKKWKKIIPSTVRCLDSYWCWLRFVIFLYWCTLRNLCDEFTVFNLVTHELRMCLLIPVRLLCLRNETLAWPHEILSSLPTISYLLYWFLEVPAGTNCWLSVFQTRPIVNYCDRYMFIQLVFSGVKA